MLPYPSVSLLFQGVIFLDSLLDQLNAIALLELLDERRTDIHGIGSQDTLLADGSVEHQLDGHTAGDTDQLGHGRVSAGDTVFAEGRGAGLLGAVGVLDLELVLEHDEVALAGAVLHLLLERGAEGVERVAARGDGGVGEEADPAQTGEDAVALVVVGEGGLGGDGPEEVVLSRGGGAEDLLGGLLPRDRGLEEVALLVAQEAHVDQDANHLREALVAEGTADDGLRLRNVVALAEGGRVTVGVRDKGETGVDEVGLGSTHQLRAGDAEDLTVLVELGVVAEGEQNAAAGPRELVAQRIVRVLGSGETTAVGEERGDLASGGVDLLDGLNSVQVVNTRVQTDLVHNRDASLLAVLLQLLHSGRDV